MKITQKNHHLTLILCVVLTAAMALSMTACGEKPVPVESAVFESGSVLGEGSTVFTFTVTDEEGTESVFEVRTDKTVVGDALQEIGILAGTEDQYGLYVKSVNGIAADYDVTGTYWAFYVNGEYAMSGVDMTDIEPGASYAMKVEK